MASCSKVDDKLMGVAEELTRDENLQWDLYQEMPIHLWEMKSQRPDESEVWYLNGCRHCAINYLNRGKSTTANIGRMSRLRIYILPFPTEIGKSNRYLTIMTTPPR